VGLNSLQTARDRLLAAGASFEVLQVNDGVALFRNPAQTMDKLRELIPGLGQLPPLSETGAGWGRGGKGIWAGAIHDSKLGVIPVYLPNLLDHTQKVLDIPAMNGLLQVELPDLPEGVKHVIVYFVDVDDRAALDKFIADVNPTDITVELRDLKTLLHAIVANDVIDYALTEVAGQYTVELVSFVSDRLLQKIEAYNQKRALNTGKQRQPKLDEAEIDNGEKAEATDEPETVQPSRPFSPIHLSDNGLELIELVSLDCQAAAGPWHSDAEIKIDKHSFVVLNGQKTKTFWDAKITVKVKPLRLKVRNIAGDETIITL